MSGSLSYLDYPRPRSKDDIKNWGGAVSQSCRAGCLPLSLNVLNKVQLFLINRNYRSKAEDCCLNYKIKLTWHWPYLSLRFIVISQGDRDLNVTKYRLFGGNLCIIFVLGIPKYSTHSDQITFKITNFTEMAI